MATYRMQLVNEDFEASHEFEAADEEAARQSAIRSAIAIGADEIVNGKKLFAAEVTVKAPDQPAQRFIATVGASPLVR
jgi:hypothetical protein